MHAQVQLVCLAPTLAIASASKCPQRAAALVPSLLELLFFSAPSATSGSSFLSVAETPHELSLVLPEARLSLFPPDALRMEPQRWRALQVASAGAGAFLSQLAVLTELTTQLARHGVSVFQISTYQTDYVLVKREDLATAVACLAAFCDVEMEDAGDQERLGGEAAVEVVTQRQSGDLSADSDDFAVHRHLLSVPDVDLFLVQIDKARVRRHVYSLIRLLFGSSQSRCGERLFLSYSETGDDVSVVTHDRAFVREMQELAASGGEGVMVSPDAWKVVQVGDTNLGFSETGIVAGQTRVLLSAGTIVFYLSTFALDYMLVKEDEWAAALATLRRHFRVLEGGFAPLQETAATAATDTE
ncbi:hypothetical protein PybrP1_006477 [[Pythium] brassicae (nom. inval.)]|nr:hypothetical protein PybrP1_006477 [[Pythium] brassicae (nom. inval.)]